MESPQEAQIRAHPIHAVLKQLLEFQESPAFNDSGLTLSLEQVWARDRVFYLATLVKSLLESAPPMLVSTSGLSNIQSVLQQAISEVGQFGSDRNPAHFPNASSYMDGVLTYFYALGQQLQTSDEVALSAVIEELRKSSTEAVQQVREAALAEIEKVKEVGASSLQSVETQRGSLENEISGNTNQIAALKSQVSDLVLAVEQQRKDAVGVIADVTARYTTEEVDLRAKFSDMAEKMKTQFGELTTDTRTISRELVDAISKAKSDAEKIVQVVGNIGVTGNYQKIANAEAAQANLWRIATIGFFSLGVLIAVIAFVTHLLPGLLASILPSGALSVNDSAGEFALRFVTAVAISLPAFYTARESARHRTNADRARRMELELASIGPFIELLPTPSKEEITKKMVERYFGNEVAAHEVKSPFDLKDIASILKEVPPIIKAGKD